MAMAVLVTGSISFARYASVVNLDKGAGAGSFSASATIDGVSALSFTNTAFWGGTVDDDKIAMNALRSINFSVNNFNVVGGVEKVSEVKMKYNLTFSAPVNFVKKLAIQLFNQDDKPMLPQVVLIDLMHAADHGHIFQTATSADYNSTYHHDLTFETAKSGNNYTAIFDGYIHDEAVKVIIKLEEYEQSTHQLLQFRTWDTSGVTSESNPTVDTEGGKLNPPLQVKFTRVIPFYRITVSMSNMVLPAGQKTTVKHSIKLAPTDSLEDDHLAGYFVSLQDGQYLPVTSIYGASQPGESIKYEMQTVKEGSFDEYYTDAAAFDAADKTPYQKKNHFNEHIIVEHDENLVGNPKHYIVGETGKFEDVSTTSYLELGSFSHEDREYIDGYYLYLKRTGKNNNYVWQLIGIGTETSPNEPSMPNVADTKYYRLKVKYGEIITKTALKLTQGILKTELKSTQDYVVRSVVETDNQKHCDVVFDITSTELLRYTVQDNASGTKTVTKIIDIEEDDLVLQERKNGNWRSTADTLHEPNLTVQPWVSETENYNNANGTVAYELETKDYIIKNVSRDIERVEVEVEDVRTTVINAHGQPEDIVYTQSNPLNLFEGNIQKVYLSSCYSKNFPFYVNVIFEQIQ